MEARAKLSRASSIMASEPPANGRRRVTCKTRKSVLYKPTPLAYSF